MYFLRHFRSLCLVSGLLVMLSACGQSEKVNSSATTVTAPSPTTAPTEANQTCPAAGKARVAVMPALPAGKQANLIYASQSNAVNVPYDATTLLRYNATTAKTTTLVKGNIAHWSISPDGQWMSLTIALQNQWAVQLIRMDGQQLQTLYCAPYFTALHFSPDQRFLAFIQTGPYDPTVKTFGPIVGNLNYLDLATGKLRTLYTGPDLADLLFSPDLHFLAFTEGENVNSSGDKLQIDILDFATGKVHAVMADWRPGFPGHGQWQESAAQSLTLSFSSLRPAQQHHPESGAEWNRLFPLKWINNKSLFILLEELRTPGPVLQLDLLHDVGKDVAQQQSNVQYVAANDDPSYRCDAFAMMPDGQHLVCSNSPEVGQLTPATIDVRAVTGGKSHTIYRGPVGYVTASIVSNSTLLITQLDAQHPATLWKINIDGSGLTRLMVAPSKDWRIEPSISNGSLYALTTFYLGNHNETDLIVGSLSGGLPKTIVKTASDTLELIEWVHL